MNIYQSFFEGINDEDWEFFATDFLDFLGFTILVYPSRGADGGKDAIVEKDGIRYIVSAKHFIKSNESVKPSKEQSISDRIIRHKAQGFIGFYSTLPSTGLSEILIGLEHYGYIVHIFDKNKISDYLPKIPSGILQKYGLPNQIKYVMNVNSYIPLNCLSCGADILSDDLIRLSLAQISLNTNEELEFLYGCKRCLINYSDIGWIEVYESLHLDRLTSWNSLVDEKSKIYLPSESFYKNKNEYDTKIQQRIFPSNWGLHQLSLLNI